MERVRENAFDFRKRTSRAEDQVVIEMLRELDSDMWETIASCFQFRLITGPRRQACCGKHSGSPWSRKRTANSRRAVFARSPCCRRFTASTSKKHCSNWRGRLCNQDGVRSMDMPLVGSRMKWCGCSDEWCGTGNGVANSGLRGGLQCGSCF